MTKALEPTVFLRSGHDNAHDVMGQQKEASRTALAIPTATQARLAGTTAELAATKAELAAFTAELAGKKEAAPAITAQLAPKKEAVRASP